MSSSSDMEYHPNLKKYPLFTLPPPPSSTSTVSSELLTKNTAFPAVAGDTGNPFVIVRGLNFDKLYTKIMISTRITEFLHLLPELGAPCQSQSPWSVSDFISTPILQLSWVLNYRGRLKGWWRTKCTCTVCDSGNVPIRKPLGKLIEQLLQKKSWVFFSRFIYRIVLKISDHPFVRPSVYPSVHVLILFLQNHVHHQFSPNPELRELKFI